MADVQWPADAVVRRSVASLIPYARNARTHSDTQVAQIAASVREWGWTVPVLIDEQDGIIAGHGRVLAARVLGLDEIPVMIAAGWSDAQKRAYIIADNKIPMNAAWDEQLLRVEIGDLKSEGFDLGLVGFSELELSGFSLPHEQEPQQGLTDPDEVPDASKSEPVTAFGDVWIMGRHRLMCGDSTDASAIATLTNGALADLCFTSPPYGQQRDYKNGGIADWDALMQGAFSVLPVKNEAQLLVNLGMIHRDGEWIPYWDGWIEWMRAAGWRRFGWYVWDQGSGLPGERHGRLAPSHEFIFHFNQVAEAARKSVASKMAGLPVGGNGTRGPNGVIPPKSNRGGVYQDTKIHDTMFRIARHKGRGIENAHPAVFPVDLVSEMLTAFSDPDDIVFEPFSGSGTQIISAQKNGRTCMAMEIAPEYADVAVLRWQNFTGQSAILESSGRTFSEVAESKIAVVA